MRRLVVVSNRVAVPKGRAGSVGGLAVGVLAALQENGGVWFGWSGNITRSQQSDPKTVEEAGISYVTIDLGRRDHAEYYVGYSNSTLWPLFHYRLDLAVFNRHFQEGYRRVNAMFASRLARMLKDDDIVWVHDYHLIRLGEELRRAGINRPLGFFLHTPLPALELLLALPDHHDLLRSLSAYDLVGFQTANDLRNFHDYITMEAGGTVEKDGTVQAFGRTFQADVFPIGIDTDNIARQAADAATSRQTRRLQASLGDRALITGVDRLDYSKGLVKRFSAFERLLQLYPANRSQVSLLQIAPPTRSEVPEYLEIRRMLEESAGHINGLFAEFDWMPIRYLNRSFGRRTLTGFFRMSVIGLVTPLRDGMNLVAKEYVASQNPTDPGVLVLSRFAGAAQEMDAALIVNPHDIDGVATALQTALEMTLEERRERWSTLIKTLRENDANAWRKRFIDRLRASPMPPLSA